MKGWGGREEGGEGSKDRVVTKSGLKVDSLL